MGLMNQILSFRKKGGLDKSSPYNSSMYFILTEKVACLLFFYMMNQAPTLNDKVTLMRQILIYLKGKGV